MGADLYLRSVHDKVSSEWRPRFDAAVEERQSLAPNDPRFQQVQERVQEAYREMHSAGYFRDPYNSGGFFPQIGISWWRDVIPLLDDEGHLPIVNAKLLLERIRSAKIVLKEEVQGEAGAMEYFEKDRADLCSLLEQSIKLDEPIYCSL